MPPPIENLHAGVAATLRTARALAASGRSVDLTGLDNLVGFLCAQALDLPAAQGRAFQTQLRNIADELDNLHLILIART